MFDKLEKINERPEVFGKYTTLELWTNKHTAKQMLKYHLNEEVDAASRNKKFIDKSTQWITSHFNLNTIKNIIDFGCGPGLYTTRLAKSGANVTGVDFSKNSLEYAKNMAKEENLDINYINTNYLDFESDNKFDLITMIMCDFCVLSPEQRKIMLKKFANILKPDGKVLLDAYTIKAFDDRVESATYELNQLYGFWSPDKYYGFVNIFKYNDERVVLDKYTIIEKDRTREVYNWLQYFSLDAIKKEFLDNGLEIIEVYSDVAGSSYDEEKSEFAIVAKKI